MEIVGFVIGSILSLACIGIIYELINKKRHGGIIGTVSPFAFLAAIALFGIGSPKFSKMLVDFTKNKIEMSELEERLTTAKAELQSTETALAKLKGQFLIGQAKLNPKAISVSDHTYVIPAALAPKVLIGKSLFSNGDEVKNGWAIINAENSTGIQTERGSTRVLLYSQSGELIGESTVNSVAVEQMVNEVKRTKVPVNRVPGWLEVDPRLKIDGKQ